MRKREMCLTWCFSFESNRNESQTSTATGRQKSTDSGGINFLDHVTPGAFSFITQMHNPKSLSEQLTLDLNELKKQYQKLKERQRQAQIIIQTASAQHRMKSASGGPSSQLVSSNPTAMTSSQQSIYQSPAPMTGKKQETGHMIVDTTMSPFSLEQAPVVNHLLIKPNDRNRNTLKQTIKLSSSAAPTTTAAAARSSNSDELLIDQSLAEKISHSKVHDVFFLFL